MLYFQFRLALTDVLLIPAEGNLLWQAFDPSNCKTLLRKKDKGL